MVAGNWQLNYAAKIEQRAAESNLFFLKAYFSKGKLFNFKSTVHPSKILNVL